MGYEQEAFGALGKNAFYSQPKPFGKARPAISMKDVGNMLTGYGEAAYGTKLQSGLVNNIKNDYENQIANAQGGNIEGIDVSSYFNPDSKTYTQEISDRRQGMLTGLYDGVSSMGDQIGKMNPYEYADYMYQQNSGARNLAQDREKAQVLEMMKARGIDVSAVGNDMFGSTVQSQNFANAGERAGYVSQGQDMQNSMVANQNALINSIYGSDAINSQQINDALAMGVNVSPPDSLGTAYQDELDAKANKGNALVDLLGMGVNFMTGGLFS